MFGVWLLLCVLLCFGLCWRAILLIVCCVVVLWCDCCLCCVCVGVFASIVVFVGLVLLVVRGWYA